MKTIDGTSNIVAFGIVKWQVFDVHGDLQAIRTPAYYIPTSDQRLFSPQHYGKFHGWAKQDADMYAGNPGRMWVMLNSDPENQHMTRIEAPISTFDSLPYIVGYAPDVKPTLKDQDKQTSIPTCACKDECSCHKVQDSFDLAYNMEVLTEANENLTPSQKELLLDHQRLGHINMSHLQELYRPCTVECTFEGCKKEVDVCLPSRHSGVSSCDQPLCLACQAARAHRRPTGSTHMKPDLDRTGVVSAGNLQPGDQIHVDNYESSIRGRLSHTKGKEKRHEQYCGGTIFYDAASGLIKVYHQSSLDAESTLVSKRLFERDAAQCGVSVQKYHADNGIFTSRKWKEVLLDKEQYQTLSGSGAHHQNPHAERAIGTVTASARAMLIHVQIHWPDEYDTRLWPLALDYAAWLYNHTPKRNCLSPVEIFCKTRTGCDYLRRAKVFGAPVYVLDPRMQNGKKIPKWEPRSRRGQFLGFSKSHSSSVGLVRHLLTGSITPQFHYVIDQKFTTVSGGQSGRSLDEMTTNELQFFITSTWSTENHVVALDSWDDNEDGVRPSLSDEWTPNRLDPTILPDPDDSDRRRMAARDRRRLTISDKNEVREFDSTLPPSDNASEIEPTRLDFDSLQDTDDTSNQSPEGGITHENDDDSPDNLPDADDDDDDDVPSPAQPGESSPSLPTRVRRVPKRLSATELGKLHNTFFTRGLKLYTAAAALIPRVLTTAYTPQVARAMHLDWTTPSDDPIAKHFEDLMEATSDPISEEVFYIHPFALQVRLNQSKDQPTLNQILNMQDDEKSQWFDSMQIELNALWDKGCFEVVDLKAAKGRQVIPLTWAFKYKSRPDGTYYKRKARLCLRGDKMIEGLEEGKSADETSGYAPVVDWGTIRMLLTMTVNFNLRTTAIDFRSAFISATLERPFYASMPPYVNTFPQYAGKLLMIKKSLYGHRFAAKLFYEMLRDNMVKPRDKGGLGFKLSLNDHCLFLRDDAILISWVDDAVIVHRDPQVANQIIKDLENCGFSVEKEEDDGGLANYLGVAIDKGDDGTLTLRQVGLIDRIIEATGMQDANPKPTPATETLPRHLDAPQFNEAYNYRSIVGMSGYLSNTTRAETAFATHQCARFSANPRKPHAAAIKRLVAYLIDTRNNGMVIRKFEKDNNKLYCWTDADFAGLYSTEDHQDPTSCRSRTGYVITLGDNPIYWSSRIQGEIADSTMAAEYIAASAAMKSLLYLRRVHQEISSTLSIPFDKESNISVIFEDNDAALKLATADPPRLTPRSKSIAIKYHWFREHLDRPGHPTGIKMNPVVSALNRANILTKPLTPDLFKRERHMIMGF